jgi:hypothetical protein
MAAKIFGEAVSYPEFQGLLCRRVAELNITLESIDALAGFAPSWASHILQRFPSKSAMGPRTLFELLEVLGLRLALIEDPEGVARFRKRSAWREQNGAYVRRKPRKFTEEFFEAEIARRLSALASEGDRAA